MTAYEASDLLCIVCGSRLDQPCRTWAGAVMVRRHAGALVRSDWKPGDPLYACPETVERDGARFLCEIKEPHTTHGSTAAEAIWTTPEGGAR